MCVFVWNPSSSRFSQHGQKVRTKKWQRVGLKSFSIVSREGMLQERQTSVLIQVFIMHSSIVSIVLSFLAPHLTSNANICHRMRVLLPQAGRNVATGRRNIVSLNSFHSWKSLGCKEETVMFSPTRGHIVQSWTHWREAKISRHTTSRWKYYNEWKVGYD